MPRLAGEVSFVAPNAGFVRSELRLTDRARLARSVEMDPSASDAELFAAAHAKWGAACAGRLTGAFAFAAWDAEHGRLVLGRDHLGEMPLFYAEVRGGVVFSTDIEDVLAHPGVRDDVDLEAFALHRATASRPLVTRTFFTQIMKVAPATVVELAPGRKSVSRYWWPEAIPPEDGGSVADWSAELRELLETCVAESIGAANGVAAHLSGGLDSSAVAVVADDILKRRGSGVRRLLSWSPPPGLGAAVTDERARVLSVCASRGWHPAFVGLGPEDLEAVADRDPLVFPTRTWWTEESAARGARLSGCEIVLSGWGGDEFASHDGRSVLGHMLRQGELSAAWRESVARGKVVGKPAVSVLAGAFLAAEPPLGGLLRRATRRRSARVAEQLECEAEIWRTGWPAVGDELVERHDRLTRCQSARDLQLAFLGEGHLALRMESWAKCGSVHGLEYRFPLLDRRIVELALRAPQRCFISAGWTRRMFRLALASDLPGDVAWGRSKHETAVLAQWVALVDAGVVPPTLAYSTRRIAQLAPVNALHRAASGPTLAGVRSAPREAPQQS